MMEPEESRRDPGQVPVRNLMYPSQVDPALIEAREREMPLYLFKILERHPYLRRHPHPMISHFPIVYMLSVTFFSLLYLATGNKSFDTTAFYCLGAGLLTMPAAALTGFYTHWLNFPGTADSSVTIEKYLTYAVMAISLAAFFWHWRNPEILTDLSGVNFIYLLLVSSLAPLVTANGYFGGLLTFPLEIEPQVPDALVRQAPAGVQGSPGESRR